MAGDDNTPRRSENQEPVSAADRAEQTERTEQAAQTDRTVRARRLDESGQSEQAHHTHESGRVRQTDHTDQNGRVGQADHSQVGATSGPSRPSASLSRRDFFSSAAAVATVAIVGCDDNAGGASDMTGGDVGDVGGDTMPSDTGRADSGSADSGMIDGGTDGDALDATDGTDLGDVADGRADLTEVSDASDTAMGTTFDPSAFTEDAALFPWGVQAGHMLTDAANIWGRTSDRLRAEPFHARVYTIDEQSGMATIVFEEAVTPDANAYMKLQATGLEPGTSYEYAFFDLTGMVRSQVGRVRTAPSPGSLAPLTMACATCSNLRNSPYVALEHMANLAGTTDPIDMICHMGDMSYNDDATTLEEYRAIWMETLLDPGYQALLPRAGMYITWDDHEVDNNFDPETMDPARLEAAKTAFFENLGAEPGPDLRLWRSYRWGDTAEIFVLDSRSERQPSTRLFGDAIYLSRAQMDWLKQGLLDSPCHFKILLNSVPITDMPLLYDAASSDRWEGYTKQRDELLGHIATNDIRNTWFLSGDFHLGFVARVQAGMPAGRPIYEIAVGPTANGPNPLAFVDHPTPQFDFVGQSSSAATLLTFDPATDSVRVRFEEGDDGTVLYDETLVQSPMM